MPRRGGKDSGLDLNAELTKASKAIPDWVQYLPFDELQLPLAIGSIFSAETANSASRDTYGTGQLTNEAYAAMDAALTKYAVNQEAEARVRAAKAAKGPDMSRIELSDAEIQQIVNNQQQQQQNQQISLYNQQIMAAQARAAQQLKIAQQQGTNLLAQSQQKLSGYTTYAQQLAQQAAQTKAANMAEAAAQNQSLQSQALMSKTITGSIQHQTDTIQNALAGERSAINTLAQNRDLLHAQALARDAAKYIPTMKTVMPTRRLPPTVTLAQISR